MTAVSGPAYVALEGAEGCGKSTQAVLLADALGAVLTRETGGTPVGARFREILHDTTVTDLADRAEALITAADRAQHVVHVVRPALAAGRLVVSDRSVHSTLAYQGYGRGLDLAELRRINDWAIDGLWPERVILLDAPTRVLAARISDRDLDRFERAGDDFHARVAAGFREMAAADPARWDVVDADGDVATVAKRVRAAYDEWAKRDERLGRRRRAAGGDRPAHRCRRGAGARLPAARAVRVDEAPGGPGVRRPAPRRRRRPRPAAPPAWRSAPSTPTSTRSSGPGRRSPPTRPARSSS